MAWVYILKSCVDGSYYVGSTIDIERRVDEHNRGQTHSTRGRTPYTLAFKVEADTYKEAHILELRLKKYKSRRILDNIVKNQTLTNR